jgi:hypothetical protein
VTVDPHKPGKIEVGCGSYQLLERPLRMGQRDNLGYSVAVKKPVPVYFALVVTKGSLDFH